MGSFLSRNRADSSKVEVQEDDVTQGAEVIGNETILGSEAEETVAVKVEVGDTQTGHESDQLISSNGVSSSELHENGSNGTNNEAAGEESAEDTEEGDDLEENGGKSSANGGDHAASDLHELSGNGSHFFNKSAIDELFEEQSNDSAQTSSHAGSDIGTLATNGRRTKEPMLCPSSGCGQVFKTKTLYNKHAKAHAAQERITANLPPNSVYDAEAERPFLCANGGCESSFKQLYHLKRHHTSVHHAGRDVDATGPTPPKRSYADVVQQPAVGLAFIEQQVYPEPAEFLGEYPVHHAGNGNGQL